MHTSDLLEQIRTAPQILVYLSHAACSVCTTLRPKVENLAGSYPDLSFLYVDIHQHPQISGQYLVFAVPTIIYFREGRECFRFSRHVALAGLQDRLDRYNANMSFQ